MADLPSRHVYILKVSIVGSGFYDEDFGVKIFGETACYYTTGRAATDRYMLVRVLGECYSEYVMKSTYPQMM